MEYRARNIEKALAYRARYKERELALARERHAENPEIRREDVRRWRKANPDKVREWNVATYAADPEKHLARAKAWKAVNMERVLEKNAQWRAENKDKVAAINARQYAKADKALRLKKCREWQATNRDKVRASVRKWNDAHPERTAQRKASKLNATPVWANAFFIREAYDLARRRTKMLGFAWHVDHIVPLQSRLVCGLHCEQNLQVVPAAENTVKGNREWPHMPCGVSV